MSYPLFIDDTREPSFLWIEEYVGREGIEFARRVDQNWVVARDFDEAADIVTAFGAPRWIAFDHDLGNQSLSGLEFAKWLAAMEMDGHLRLPDDFDYFVHSQNPVGAENIRAYMKNYMEKGRS